MQNTIHSLNEKIIFVAGNAPRLSQGIIKSFLQAGATVIAPAINLEEINALKLYVGAHTPGHLITQILDVPDCEQITAFAESIQEKFGGLDMAVSAVECTSNTKELSEVEPAVWQNMQDTDINLFFMCARITLPLLKQTPDALYVSVCHSAYPDSAESGGLAALAYHMRADMSRHFSREARQQHTRYYHVEVPHLDAGTEPAGPAELSWPANYDLVGDYIQHLYAKPTKPVRNAFRLFPTVAHS